MFRKDYCRSGAIYRRRRAGVHSPASFIGFFSAGAIFSTVVFSSAVDSPSARLADSRLSEIASINLIASRSMGTPKIRAAKMSNRRNEPAVSIIEYPERGALTKEAEGLKLPLRLEHPSEVSRSIPLNDGLRNADERNQTDDHQHLYQHGIPESHNFLLRREPRSRYDRRGGRR